MIHRTKNFRLHQFQLFKKAFLQIPGFPFSEFLSTELLDRICCSGKRDRIFTPLVVLKTFLLQVLCADGSCKQAVARVLTERLQQAQPPKPVNTGPYGKARKRLPLAFREAVTEIGQKLHQMIPSPWKWKGHSVVLVDGTTALMPDTPENQARFPQQHNQKPGIGFPITRIVALISLSAGAILDYALGPYQGICGTALKSFCQTTLNAMASTPIAQQKRPNQPRAVKRRPKPYPLITIPRQEACQLIYS